MKTIIAGSRTITDALLIKKTIEESKFEITEVVCGLAKGVDSLGKLYAIKNKIPIKEFPADWRKYGRAAGSIRNKEMAEYADACIVVFDGHSRGSLNMIDNANKYKLKLFVKVVE